jgi:hypothetical protein
MTFSSTQLSNSILERKSRMRTTNPRASIVPTSFLDGSVAHIEPSEEPHRPSSVRAIVDLSDDVVVSPHAPNDGEAEAETEPTAQPARQSAEKAAKSGKQQSRTRVALDTF